MAFTYLSSCWLSEQELGMGGNLLLHLQWTTENDLHSYIFEAFKLDGCTVWPSRP